MKKVQILNNEEIKQKTTRIAYQIVEENYDAKELVMVGIQPNGLQYAQQLKKEIEAVVATFERYDYRVLHYFGEKKHEDSSETNYRNLMNYLDL